MTYALAAADGNLSRVTREAKTIIVPALAGATGAAEIKVIGGEQTAITITLDASRLAAHQLAPFRVSQALTGAQVDLPAGQSLNGNKVVPVEVVSAVKTAADLRALPAILVIFLFLRSVRATLVTAVSLPTSVLVALLGTDIGGFSLNILTLAGLTIAVGRIIDDAIVVLENSYRHLQMGESPKLAALNGASEVSKAVVSSTLTTVAVFLPIAVVGGIISKFFVPFSVTVTISLLASLLVALTLIPVLVSFFLQRRASLPAEHRDWLHRAYQPVLGWALANRLTKVA